MTTATLISRIQTLLDDASDSFFDTDDIYEALTEGQNAVIKLNLAIWKAKREVKRDAELPEVLRVCLSSTTGTGTDSLPTDYYEYVDIYTSTAPVRVRELNRLFSGRKFITLLASTSDEPYCYFTDSQIVFETSVSWTMQYISKPTAIASGVNPVLPDTYEDALVNYGYMEMMRRDKQLNLANDAFNRFIQSVQQNY